MCHLYVEMLGHLHNPSKMSFSKFQHLLHKFKHHSQDKLLRQSTDILFMLNKIHAKQIN